MKQTIYMLALAGAAGLACPALAQQGQIGAQVPQSAAAPAAAQAPAEQPPSPEETLADHRESFFARVQARKQAAGDAEVDLERQEGIRYHPAW